jgi:hypothetical protein
MIATKIAKPVPPSDTSGLIAAVTGLTSVLEAENAALRQSDFGASGALTDAKRAAIVGLESITSAQQHQADRVPAALHRKLDDAVDQNRALLRRSIETQQRVIATILQALDPAHTDHHYPAQYGTDHPHPITAPIALTLRA